MNDDINSKSKKILSEDNEFKYNDILNYKYPNPEIEKDFTDKIIRAAQFAPFAALTGHDAAISETARHTEEWVDLDPCEEEDINQKLLIIMDITRGVNIQYINDALFDKEVSINYFVKDKRKSGGRYQIEKGEVLKVDRYKEVLVMKNRKEIPINSICGIDGRMFDEISIQNDKTYSDSVDNA